MIKYIVLVFLLIGCGSDPLTDSHTVNTVETCTTYDTWSGTTEYCEVTIDKYAGVAPTFAP